MPPVGFEPTISAGERPQTDASDRAATGTGCNVDLRWDKISIGAIPLCCSSLLSKCLTFYTANVNNMDPKL